MALEERMPHAIGGIQPRQHQQQLLPPQVHRQQRHQHQPQRRPMLFGITTALLLLLAVCVPSAFGDNEVAAPNKTGAVKMTSKNIDMTLASNQLVFLNFYADWCRFSAMLQPIFDEAATRLHAEFSDAGQVVLGKVDCDDETAIASRFQISKYPTLKLVLNGQPAKREYRGARTADAFVEFIQKQLIDPVIEYHSLRDLEQLDGKQRIVVGYFDRKDQNEYKLFKRVAVNLKDDCKFYAGFGETVAQMHPPGTPIVVFRPDTERTHAEDETYEGGLINVDELAAWAQQKCVPLVREITFDNAEELTEEGLPFLILFHDTDDTESVKNFKLIVESQLLSEKQNINFLTADGKRFAHPLHHLGKAQSDLPLIAIDSFRHMYLFPDTQQMYTAGKLKAFLDDLYSGKLHREFHYGPSEPSGEENAQAAGDAKTQPPESTFKKLAPSNARYTLLRDEL